MVESIEYHDVYRKCPECGHLHNKHCFSLRIISEDEVAKTITFAECTEYVCKHCGHRWE